MNAHDSEVDEAMREEFDRLWKKSIVPNIKRTRKNWNELPEDEQTALLFTSCWMSYCVGLRKVEPPK